MTVEAAREAVEAAREAVEAAREAVEAARESGSSAEVLDAQQRLEQAMQVWEDLDTAEDHEYDEEERPNDEGGPRYATCAEWVTEYLLPMWRPNMGAKWCQYWWLHPEGVSRLEALWRSWEAMRLDGPTGMSAWLRDHYDPHMDRLSSPSGPFHRCDETEHKQGTLRTSADVPEGLFTD